MYRLGGRTLMSSASLLLFGAIFAGMVIPGLAQDPSGREVAAALKRKDIPPAPRWADGHPDLGNGAGAWAAPAIDNMGGGKTPREGGGGGGGAQPEKVVEVPMLPWAKALFDKRASRDDIQDPEAYCLVPGHPRYSANLFPFQINQLPGRIIFLYEKLNSFRVVYMDGRKHTPPEKWNVNYQGESIGHWEGDTLVIDITGSNDKSWLDAAGHPKTEQLHLIERWTRVNELIMHYEVTVDDPGAYSKPWGNSWNMLFHPGMELLDYVCEDNDTILKRLTPDKH
jgi:hypothetical protein